MANYRHITLVKNWRMGKICMILCILLAGSQLYASSEQRVIAFGNISINHENFPLIEQHLKYANHISEEPFAVLFIGGFLDGDSCHIDLIKKLHNYSDRIHLIPGTHEWKTLGSTGIANLDDLLKDAFDNDVFIPDNACGEIESKTLHDEIELLAIDSKWFLQDWKSQDELNKNCDIESRDQFLFEFRDEVMSNKEKTVLLTTYHPPYRFDNKSGDYKFLHHIFPFTTKHKHALLPLPIVSTLFFQAQSFLRSHEFQQHPRYRKLSESIEDLADDHQRMVIISGDGRQSTVLEKENCLFINICSNEDKSSYHVPTEAKLIDKSSVLYLNFSTHKYRYAIRTLSDPDELLLEGHKELPAIIKDEIPTDTLEKKLPNYSHQTIFNDDNLTHLGADWLTGTLYTDLYKTPIKAPTLDLTKGEDLMPFKIGGGQQTISVRLRNRLDQNFVVRSLQKKPTKLLAKKLRISIIEDFVEYYFTSAHPFAFLAVPVLEESLGLYHTNPTLYFLPAQKQLAPYNDEIGNQLVLFRERADEDWSASKSLGRSTEIVSTSDMKEDLLENKITVDARFYLKNRLLDLTLGDWDRHSDQWRWAKGPERSNQVIDTLYPVGRDRDQAMYNFDGFLIKVLRFYDPSFKVMRTFDRKITRSDIRWQSYSAKSLDHLLLNTLNKEDWMQIAREMKSDISRKTVEDAIDKMPHEIPVIEKEKWTNILWERFQQIEETANLFYEEFQKSPVIYGSIYSDSIYIDFDRGTSGSLTIKSEDKDGHWTTKLSRVIEYEDIHTLRIHAMEGNDVFIINKEVRSPGLTLLGGYGEDVYKKEGSGANKNLKIIEHAEEDQSSSSEFNITTTNRKNVDEIPHKGIMPNYFSLNPAFRANRDDGLFLGVSGNYKQNQFKKTINHYANLTFATKRKSSRLAYRMEIQNELKKSITFLDVNIDGPRYESNFFGMGNESTYDPVLDESHYYLRRQLQNISTGIKWSLGSLGDISLAAFGERITLQEIEERYVNAFIQEKAIKGPNHFAGLHFTLDFTNFNSRFKVTDGVKLGMNIIGKKGLDNQQNHVLINPYYHLYKSIGPKKNIIYSTKIQFRGIIGDYFFFQAPTLGGTDYLRGYRRERFRGRSLLAQNNNLHIRLTDRISRKYFPAGAGVTASFDHGRVWLDNEESKKWHYNWGLGIWISPLNAFVISAGVYRSPESTELRARLGWQF